jgi:hypothetical protein
LHSGNEVALEGEHAVVAFASHGGHFTIRHVHWGLRTLGSDCSGCGDSLVEGCLGSITNKYLRVLLLLRQSPLHLVGHSQDKITLYLLCA